MMTMVAIVVLVVLRGIFAAVATVRLNKPAVEATSEVVIRYHAASGATLH